MVRCNGFSRFPSLEFCALSFFADSASSFSFSRSSASSSSPFVRLPSSVVSRVCKTTVACLVGFVGVRGAGALSCGVGMPGIRMGEGDSDDGIRSSYIRDGIDTLSPSSSTGCVVGRAASSGSGVRPGRRGVAGGRGERAGWDPLRSKASSPNVSIWSACPGLGSSTAGSKYDSD